MIDYVSEVAASELRAENERGLLVPRRIALGLHVRVHVFDSIV